MLIEVLILTCSAKHRGYCVAGIELKTRSWIRLVSSKDVATNEIPYSFMHYSNGKDCNPLDIVSVDIFEDIPGEIQKENVLINLLIAPRFIRRINLHELEPYISTGANIFGSTSEILTQNEAMQFGYSLAMYLVKDIQFYYNEKGKSKVKFCYEESTYENWSMTDPSFYGCASGLFFDQALIVVSIPEDDYNGDYYKFVSKIIII